MELPRTGNRAGWCDCVTSKNDHKARNAVFLSGFSSSERRSQQCERREREGVELQEPQFEWEGSYCESAEQVNRSFRWQFWHFCLFQKFFCQPFLIFDSRFPHLLSGSAKRRDPACSGSSCWVQNGNLQGIPLWNRLFKKEQIILS